MVKKLLVFTFAFFLLSLSACFSDDVEIRFNSNGGSEIETITKKEDFDVNHLPTPIREGYQFEGWFLDSELKTPIIGNVPDELTFTLYAKWKEKQYTITYHCNGGTEILPTTHSFGSTINLPPAPTRVNYQFVGWFEDAELKISFTLTTMPSRNVNLYAKWEEVTYQVVFVPNAEGVIFPAPIVGALGSPISEPIAPNRVGYDFCGWYVDQNYTTPFQFTTMPEGGATLYAKWQIKQFTITFVSRAQTSVESLTAVYQTPIQEPEPPIRLGYTFQGWYRDEEGTIPFVFDRMPAENLTLYAKWEAQDVTITFYNQNDTLPIVRTGKVGSPLEKPIPEYPGYTFVNWYYEEEYLTVCDSWVFPTHNINLYAKWEPNLYTITFITGDASIVIDPLQAKTGQAITLPIPNREGYRFLGWYLDSSGVTPFNETKMPVGGATVYAKWIASLSSTPIKEVLLCNLGTEVTTRGVVYARLSSPYPGFYITDGDDQIFIFTDQTNVAIGDEVYLTGYFERWNGVPMLNGITSLTVEAHQLPISQAEELNFASIKAISPSDETYGARYLLRGVITNDGEQLYLTDAIALDVIKIDHRSYDRFQIENEILNKNVVLEVVLTEYQADGWKIGIVENTIQEGTISDSERVNLIKAMLLAKYNHQTYEPLASFTLPAVDPFGWSTISFHPVGTNATLYDEDNQMFRDTSSEKEVNFQVDVSIGEISSTFLLSVNVSPRVIISIEELRELGMDNKIHYIKGIVLIEGAIIQDDSGYILVYDEEGLLELGTEVIVAVTYITNDYYGFCRFYQDYEVVSVGNPLPDPNRYYGFEIKEQWENNELYHDEFVELEGTLRYKILTDDFYLNYLEFENGFMLPFIEFNQYNDDYLEKYQDINIVVKGFLYHDEFFGWGIRAYFGAYPIEIPFHSDAEAVAMIQDYLVRKCLNQTFYANDKFVLPETHPVLGGTIEWTFANESKPYYLINEQRFAAVSEETPITVLIKVRKNNEVINFFVNFTVHPISITKLDQIHQVGNGETVYVQGIVIHRTSSWLMLQDDTGMVWINTTDASFLVGDEVLLQVIKNSVNRYNYLSWNVDQNYQLLSFNQPFTLTPNVLKQMELANLKKQTSIPLQYVEISGLISKDGPYFIHVGEERLKIEFLSTASQDRLETSLGKMVTIKGFLKGYDNSLKCLNLLYLGGDEELLDVEDADQMKLSFIKDYVKVLYHQKEFPCNASLQFVTTHPTYGGMIQYAVYDDVYGCVSIENNYLSLIQNSTEIGIHLTISFGSVNETFDIWFMVLGNDSISSQDDPISIAEFKSSNGEVRTVLAKILEISDDYILVGDITGCIYVETTLSSWNYSSYIYRYYYITGSLANVRGRYEIVNATLKAEGRMGEETVDYEEVPLSNIVARDHRDDANFGVPVTITGTLIQEDYYDLYLTDGFDKVKILGRYNVTGSSLENFLGNEITVQGRIFGLSGSGEDLWSITLTKGPVQLSDYTPLEKIQKVGSYLLDLYNQRVYDPYETFYFQTNHSLFPMTITYNCIRGQEFVEASGNGRGRFLLPNRDTEITFAITLSLSDVTETYQFKVLLKGFEVSNLSDLYSPENINTSIALRGFLLYKDEMNGIGYFLVDGVLYLLKNVNLYDYRYEVGAECIIWGRKTIQNNEINIHSNAKVYLTGNRTTSLNVIPTPITLLEVYQADLELNDLRKQCLQVVGILRYDNIMKQYFLEDDGIKALIRINPNEVDYLSTYLINRKVSMNVFYPNSYFGDYVILDLIQLKDITRLDETPEEIIEIVLTQLTREFDGRFYYAYERFLNNPIIADLTNGFGCTLSWTLLDGEISDYFNLNRNYLIYNVDDVTTYSLVVTVKRVVNMIEYTGSTTLDIVVHPRATTTIQEMMHSPSRRYYCIKGIILLANSTNENWFYLQDETGVILVDHSGGNFHGISKFKQGDEVILYGYYVNQSYPYIAGIDDIVVLSLNNSGSSRTPLVVTIGEIVSQDLTNPRYFNQLLSITGTIELRTINYYEKYYCITDGTNDLFLKYADSSSNLDVVLNQLKGQQVTLNSYLFGYDDYYDELMWYITFDGVVIS